MKILELIEALKEAYDEEKTGDMEVYVSTGDYKDMEKLSFTDVHVHMGVGHIIILFSEEKE